MKWGIIILVVLGLVAAACAALLVGAIGGGSSAAATGPTGIEVAVAKKSTPQMTLITVDHFIKQTVSKNDFPPGQQMVNPDMVVGRLLGVPVVEGQVLTESCFVPEGTSQRLIGGLPDGFRLYTIPVPSRGLPDRFLLNPGCMVDVLVSFKLSTRSEAEALSTPLLQGMEVVAVSGESVLSDPEETKDAKTRRAGGEVQVTLLVSSKQAEALQLAVDNASSITLLIRNPLDKTEISTDGSILIRGRLASPASPMSPADLKPAQSILGTGAAVAAPAMSQPPFEEQYQSRPNPQWQIEVIRGSVKETKEFDVQASGISGQKEEK
jgi:Flp pilus assembly protein CpaB